MSIVQTANSLEIAFSSKSLRKICETEAEAKLQLGDAVSESLKHRLADLCAATSSQDLVVGQPRVINGGALMALDLCEGYSLVFEPNHNISPTKNNKLDWPRISRIKLIRIEHNDA